MIESQDSDIIFEHIDSNNVSLSGTHPFTNMYIQQSPRNIINTYKNSMYRQT